LRMCSRHFTWSSWGEAVIIISFLSPAGAGTGTAAGA